MGDLGRLHPEVVIKRKVVNQSYRADGVKIALIVLHDTESHNTPGNADLEAIGNWFDNPSAQASAHVAVDGDGHSAIYVDSVDKAWHVSHYNSASLGIEQIGFSTEGTSAWENRPEELKEAARWIARWSIMYRIPILHASVDNGLVTHPGVITHRELGSLGGGHDDPNPAYPFNHVLDMANRYRSALLS